LTTAGGAVQLPAPLWDVIPDPNPAAPPQVVAQIEAPEPPEGIEFGEALWVKVFTTEFEDPTELEDLVGDNLHVQEAETEIEWQLLQKDFKNPDSGQLESGYGVPVGPNAASILRRYEFYEFSGEFDPETHEAQFEPPYGDSHPGPNDVGIYLGSQNAAVNLGPVPSGLSGDYNNDGAVDAADYPVWRHLNGTNTTLPNDTTPGSVASVDYDVWRANFGAIAGSGSGIVPEPATLVLLTLATSGIRLRSRHIA
jgi:hypothetical protein